LSSRRSRDVPDEAPRLSTWWPTATSVRVGLLVAVLLLVYASVLYELAAVWWHRDDYSYGFLITPIAAYVAWTKRPTLRRLPISHGDRLGFVLLIAGAGLLAVGTAGHLIAVTGLSFVVMIIGLIAFLFGRAFVRAFSFSLAYLVLMIPLFDELLGRLHWPLQLLTADMAARLLEIVGIPSLVDRQFIILPGMTLEVAEACSGVTYVVSALAIGLPLAHMTLAACWARLTLVVVGLGVAVVANSLRVFLIGVWVRSGAEVLHGPLELFRAMFVSWVGVLAVFAVAWGLSKVSGRRRRTQCAMSLSAKNALTVSDVSGWNRHWMTAIVILMVGGAYAMAMDRGYGRIGQEPPALPHIIADWSGQPTDPAEALVRLADADRELMRVYHRQQGRPLQVYVAVQNDVRTLVGYRTGPLHRDAATLAVTLSSGDVVHVNQGRWHGPQGEWPILFWYDIKGHPIADRYRAKLEIMQSVLLGRPVGGALVIIAGDSLDDIETVAQMEAFVQALLPRLRSRELPA